MGVGGAGKRAPSIGQTRTRACLRSLFGCRLFHDLGNEGYIKISRETKRKIPPRSVFERPLLPVQSQPCLLAVHDNRQNKPELSLFCSLICLARGDCQLTSRIDALHHAVKQLTTQNHETQFPTLRVHPIKAELLHWSGLRCHLGPQDGKIKLRS